MSRLIGAVASCALVISLAACASAPAVCVPSFPAGEGARLVTASGAIGSDPKADFPTPLVVDATQATTVEAGKGAQVQPGDTAVIQVTLYNAKSGGRIISTDYTGAGLILGANAGEPAFGKVAQCATSGSRTAAVGSAGALLGQAAIDQNKLPVKPTDTVVMVVDVLERFLGRANGSAQVPQSSLPSIVLAPDGRPGFVIPKSAPPTELQVAVLQAGEGAEVKKGDTVVLHYTGVLWDSRKVFDSTWERNAPALLLAESLVDNPKGLVPGFATALIGQRVGSQVLAVIPPAVGYPTGSAPTTVPDGSTMVFVFDVLGIAAQK